MGREGQALPFNIVFELLHLFRGGDVALVAQHDLGTLGQLGAEARQLMVDLLKVRLGVAALAAGHIHHVQQQPAALHMAQEIMAQAHAFGGALNEAGDIGADKALFRAHPHHAQHGVSVVK